MRHYSDVISVPQCFKSSANPLYAQELARDNSKENKAPQNWPFILGIHFCGRWMELGNLSRALTTSLTWHKCHYRQTKSIECRSHRSFDICNNIATLMAKQCKVSFHWSPVNSPHKDQWRGALMFSLICVWINSWVNNREAGDLRLYRAHYDVTVMTQATYNTVDSPRGCGAPRRCGYSPWHSLCNPRVRAPSQYKDRLI